jgi:hypothetical protein
MALTPIQKKAIQLGRQEMPDGEWFTHGEGMHNRFTNFFHIDQVIKVDHQGFVVSGRKPTKEELKKYCNEGK